MQALEKVSSTGKRCPCVLPVQFRRSAGAFARVAPAKVDAVALSRRRVEHGHLSVGLKIHCLAVGISSLLWWKVLEERNKFSMSITTNTAMPHSALCCPRWAVLDRRYSF